MSRESRVVERERRFSSDELARALSIPGDATAPMLQLVVPTVFHGFFRAFKPPWSYSALIHRTRCIGVICRPAQNPEPTGPLL